MTRALSALWRQMGRRPGLAWVIALTTSVLIVTISGARSEVRLPFVMLFILTVPGSLVIDLTTPRDLIAKVIIGIAGSVSFYLVVVSIALLGSPTWLLPVAGVFLAGLVSTVLRSRSRRRRAERVEDDRQPEVNPT